MNNAALIARANDHVAENLFRAIRRLTALGQELHASHAAPDPDVFTHLLDQIDQQSGSPTDISADAIAKIDAATQTLLQAAHRSTPDHRRAIADALAQVGEALHAVQRPAAASRAYAAATQVYRMSASASPDLRAALAIALNNLGVSRMREERIEDAIQSFRDCIAIRTELANEALNDVNAMHIDLARTWNNLCTALIAARRFRAALRALRESVVLCEKVAHADPETSGSRLVFSLLTLAMLLTAEGRRHAAMNIVAEVDSRFGGEPGAHVDQMCMFLHGFFTACALDDIAPDAHERIDDHANNRSGRER